MNALFAPPFGGLVEVKPGGSDSFCYLGGENSGLMYSYHMGAKVTPKESFCQRDQKCWLTPQNRRVKIGKDAHRSELRTLVRNGLARIVHLRERFSNGIPTSLQLPEQRYVIDQ